MKDTSPMEDIKSTLIVLELLELPNFQDTILILVKK